MNESAADPNPSKADAAEQVFIDLELGTMRAKHTPLGWVLYAPSLWTRGVWLLGAAGCLLYLYSVVVSLGWVGTDAGRWVGRWPSLSETPFWLLPLLLGALSLLLSLGSTRLALTDTGLELVGLWPGRSRREFDWSELILTRFWDEQTRSRERLYGMRLRFQGANITVYLGDKNVWEALRKRFG